MAKHYVKDFTLEIRRNDKYHYVFLDIVTEISKKYRYEILSDTRQPTLGYIYDNLYKGLTLAKEECKKIDISEYLERMYVFIDLPINTDGSNQYTARKLD